jgi:hypothetical protein
MKKMKVMLLVGLLILATGCSNNKGNTDGTTEKQTETESVVDTADGTTGETTSEKIEDTPADIGTSDKNYLEELVLKDLVLNEYKGLQMTAEVLERKAIIGGSYFPVTITIKNTGDKVITYTRGSGSYETPEALLLYAGGLQFVIPEDRLGIATMDMRVELLELEEELTYTLQVRATVVNESFDNYTYMLYTADETYIGTMEWSELQEAYPDIEPAPAGEYKLKTYFMYSVVTDEAAEENVLHGATGYAEAELTVMINE